MVRCLFSVVNVKRLVGNEGDRAAHSAVVSWSIRNEDHSSRGGMIALRRVGADNFCNRFFR